MIKIAPLDTAHEVEYRAFLLRDPRSLIYSTLEYRDFLDRAVGGVAEYFLALDECDRIQGVLPTFQLSAPGVGRVLNSLPWYGSHGGCVVGADAPAGVREALINRFATLSSDLDVLASTLILSPYEEKEVMVYRFLMEPTVSDWRIGQITPLPVSGGDIAARLEAVIAQKTRNLARKSLKQGFVLKRDSSDEAWEFLYQIHRDNMQAIGGRAKPQSHFEALRQTLPHEWQQVSVAMLDNEPVAALLLLYFNKTVEYFTPVIRQQYRSLQPLSFLIWHGMLDAIERGYCWWNWGGTWANQKTLHHFKAGWGAVDMPYSYMVHTSPGSLARLQQLKPELAELFPYYYIFPYDKL